MAEMRSAKEDVVYRRWGLSPRPENKQFNYNANKRSRQRVE